MLIGLTALTNAPLRHRQHLQFNLKQLHSQSKLLNMSLVGGTGTLDVIEADAFIHFYQENMHDIQEKYTRGSYCITWQLLWVFT